jgi:uncharacterized damage-inducible protein DinB
MSVSADTLRIHLDYHTWASRRLLDAVAQLTPEEQSRDFKTSDSSPLHTLAHVFAADRLWLTRMHGESPTKLLGPGDSELGVLTTQWPVVLDGLKQFLAPMTDQDVQARISYRDTRGNPWEQPLWQILLHVVNHGTHHRGQVSGFLRAMGHNPPSLDLIAFYWTLSER